MTFSLQWSVAKVIWISRSRSDDLFEKKPGFMYTLVVITEGLRIRVGERPGHQRLVQTFDFARERFGLRRA